jgi:hypothetical protein
MQQKNQQCAINLLTPLVGSKEGRPIATIAYPNASSMLRQRGPTRTGRVMILILVLILLLLVITIATESRNRLTPIVRSEQVCQRCALEHYQLSDRSLSKDLARLNLELSTGAPLHKALQLTNPQWEINPNASAFIFDLLRITRCMGI